MVLNTNVINLAPKVTENFQTNLEASASPFTAVQPHALRSWAAAQFQPPGARLGRVVIPTVCFRETPRRFEESTQGWSAPDRSQAAGRANQPPRGPGARQ